MTFDGAKFQWRGQRWDFVQAAVKIPVGEKNSNSPIEIDHVLIVDRDAEPLARFDADDLAPKPFAALPVLGVPGWWSENEAPAFYADAAVFRVALQTKTAAGAAVS